MKKKTEKSRNDEDEEEREVSSMMRRKWQRKKRKRETFCEVLLRLEALAAGAAGHDGLSLPRPRVELRPLLRRRHRSPCLCRDRERWEIFIGDGRRRRAAGRITRVGKLVTNSAQCDTKSSLHGEYNSWKASQS